MAVEEHCAVETLHEDHGRGERVFVAIAVEISKGEGVDAESPVAVNPTWRMLEIAVAVVEQHRGLAYRAGEYQIGETVGVDVAEGGRGRAGDRSRHDHLAQARRLVEVEHCLPAAKEHIEVAIAVDVLQEARVGRVVGR